MERYRYFFESILNALIKDCWGGMKNEINIMSNQIESVWYLISGGWFFFYCSIQNVCNYTQFWKGVKQKKEVKYGF